MPDKLRFKIKDLSVEISSVTAIFADGSKSTCEYLGAFKIGGREDYRFKCSDTLVNLGMAIEGSRGTINFSASSLKSLSHIFPLEIEISADKPSRLLTLTTHKDSAKHHISAFGYYNQIAIGKEPKSPKPPDDPEYPPELGYVEHEVHVRGYPCWAYPVFLRSFEEIPYYSIFLLADYGGKYMALLTLTDKTTAYLWPGLKLKVFSGKTSKNIEQSVIASLAVDEDPYKAIEECVNAASSHTAFKPRHMKRKPIIMDRIGWCSWNALLTDDLSHENVVKIVGGLINRGLRLSWVIIDDGWQEEVSWEGWPRRSLNRLSANKRFPDGISGVVKSLKDLGVDLVGLWHTINIHWGGFEEEVLRELDCEGFLSRFVGSYVPPPSIDEAFKLYESFFSWVRENSVDFVKIDNQWVIHALYNGLSMVGEAAKNVEISMQAAAYANGLDILNCMCMVPENYSNFLFSNVMRVSMDYIPFWKGDAKLHTIFSVYNALLFSHIAYPDYDMFMSYDPYAKIHAVARVFSGGPIYITDREVEKTDISLLRRFILPDGRLVKVDKPALPTRDALFRDPYNEPVLLKIASEANGSICIAVFNVSRAGGRIEDSISLNILPFPAKRADYAYYKAFSGESEILKQNGEMKVSLGELETEVISLVPVEDGKAVIGLKEYMLPRFPIKVLRLPDGRFLVESLVSGTLLYYADGAFYEAEVKEGSIMKI
ncbi:MAG: Sip1-related alpha-galactosidase [Candidatus Bathyarchaeia archaeon]